MATLLELVEDVQEAVDDASWTQQRIIRKINDVLLDIAGSTLAPLPLLESTGTVATSTTLPYVAMPATYQRELTLCYSAALQREIPILASLEHLRALYPQLSLAGYVRHAAISANQLYYQYIPAVADTLTLHFFKLPTVLSVLSGSTADTCVPNCLPAHLQKRLLVNGVCKDIFSKIEDGIDAQKVNTAWHDKEFQKAMADLNYWVGPPKRRPVSIVDTMAGQFS